VTSGSGQWNVRCALCHFPEFALKKNHLIEKNLYVAGTLAGWRSQFSIASGSGAHVATDILTLWNDGRHTKVHDKLNE